MNHLARGLMSFCVVVCSVIGVISPLRAADSTSGAWIGAWSASPQPFLPGSLLTIRNQTLRLIIHTSIGGDSLRLHLSNTYGDKPLSLGVVRVALRDQGADTQAQTAQRVTFSGISGITIPVGATVISDPVPLKFSQFADLAVSLYFAKEASAMTSHLLAQQANYLSSDPGDQTAVSHFKIGKTLHSWPLLTAVDVRSYRALGSLVVFGDSTVDGDGSSPDGNHRWPDEIARALTTDAPGKEIAVLNAGLVGNRLLHGSPSQPPSEFGQALGEAGTARFERDALSSPLTKWVIVRIGINDIGLPGALAPANEAATATDLIAGYSALIDKANQHHVKLYIATLTPFEGADVGEGYYSPKKESARQEINSWIRQKKGFEAVLDLDAVLRDPQHPTRLLPAYDSGDHLHPNDAGNAFSAAAITRQLLGVS